MTAAHNPRASSRAAVHISADRAADSRATTTADSRTVRVDNLMPDRPVPVEVEMRELLSSLRIGGVLRVGVPLDIPRDLDGRKLESIASDRWTSSRAFICFNTVERAARAASALNGLSRGGAILIARRQGKAVDDEPASSDTSTTSLPAPCDFPDLLVDSVMSTEQQVWPLPGPHTVLPVPCRPTSVGTAEEDAASTAAETEASAATTCQQRFCKYCKAIGHVARLQDGEICCPVLFEKVLRDGDARVAKAVDRKVNRKLRQHEAETSGWTTVGGKKL